MSVVIDGTLGITSPAETIATNLTFTGTGNRITGDFSSSTIANRAVFRTSAVDGQTGLVLIPNGTSTQSIFEANSDSTGGTNASIMSVGAFAAGDVRLASDKRGTGTYLPMTFYTGGSERARIDTSGNVGIGTSSPVTKFQVSGFVLSGGQNYSARFSDAVNSTYSIGHQSGLTNLITDTAMAFYTSNTERMRIDTSGRVTTPYQTAFQGYTTSNSAAGIQTGYTATLNVGSNFLASTGRFTAPVAGTYMFAFSTLGSVPGSPADIYLFINGTKRSDVMSIRPCGTNSSQSYTPLASNTGLVALSVGDYVEISASQGLYSDGNIWQHFSGYLLG